LEKAEQERDESGRFRLPNDRKPVTKAETLQQAGIPISTARSGAAREAIEQRTGLSLDRKSGKTMAKQWQNTFYAKERDIRKSFILRHCPAWIRTMTK
jgi:hypothetical protein